MRLFHRQLGRMFIAAALALALPWCCCSAQIFAAVNGSTDSECASSCCAEHQSDQSDTDAPLDGGCGGICCIKGLVQSHDASFDWNGPILSVPAIPAAPFVADVVSSDAPAPVFRESDVYRPPTLLRLRCALIL